MRIVIKIGTSTLTHKTGNMNIRRIEELCKTVADVKNDGNEVIIVSSGAIAVGTGKLGLLKRPEELSLKQAAAAVGQCELMYVYDRIFEKYNHTVAQILLTGEDIKDEKRHENFSNTMKGLLGMNVLPIINENDTVSTEEIALGDNDTLGALVAESVKADLLIVLSDTDGFYDKDPHKNADAKLISVIDKITPEIEELAGGKGSQFGTGGMITKIHAAKICTAAGCDMIITNGSNPDVIYDILDGKSVGTKFLKVKK